MAVDIKKTMLVPGTLLVPGTGTSRNLYSLSQISTNPGYRKEEEEVICLLFSA